MIVKSRTHGWNLLIIAQFLNEKRKRLQYNEYMYPYDVSELKVEHMFITYI